MKRTSILAIALLSAFAIPAIQQARAAAQPLDGVISDSMCGRKHMASAKTDAECTRMCVKQGASYALVTKDKVYKLATKPETIARFAGKHVHIEGRVNGNTITVSSVHEAMANMPADMPM
jgi:hypothetical protein